MTKLQRRGFVGTLLLGAVALAASAATRAAHATDIEICNDGALRFSVATATRRGDGLFTPYSWYFEGWFNVERDQCATFPDHTDQPIYVAVGFTDADDYFGAAYIDLDDDEDEDDDDADSDWKTVDRQLCLAPDTFHYERDGEKVEGPCDDGFGKFPASLYLKPDGYTDSYTMNIALDADSIADEPGEINGTRAAQESEPYSGGRSFGDELTDAFLRGLAKSYQESVERAADQSRGDGGSLPAGQPTAVQSPAPAELGPPKPFEPGTLNAKLFGTEIVRRAGGDGVWFVADGTSVDDSYQLRGMTKADLLDPPMQQPAEAERAAAMQALTTTLARYGANRGAEVAHNGRLFYAYASDSGTRHDGANLVTLGLEYAKVEDHDGYSALLVECRTSDQCVLAWGEDANGKPTMGEAFEAFRVYAANHADAEAVLGALTALKRLYPAEPEVTSR
jgi:hypothetical protein